MLGGNKLKVLGALVALILVAWLAFGGPGTPPTLLWIESLDGSRPQGARVMTVPWEDPSFNRLTGYEVRAEPSVDGAPRGFAIRARKGLREKLLGSSPDWIVYEATDRNSGVGSGVYWAFRRKD